MNWLQKYKPTTFQDLLLPNNKTYRSILTKLFSTGECPFYGALFYGSGGSGKTTSAELFAEISGWWVHKLKETGESVGTLEKLSDAISTVPWGSSLPINKHLVIGHEISESSKKFRDGLRSLIDNHNSQAFFLFTDNDHNKLRNENPWLFDGQRIIDIGWNDLDRDEFYRVLEDILEKEGKVSMKNKERAQEVANTCYPSIRQAIAVLEAQV